MRYSYHLVFCKGWILYRVVWLVLWLNPLELSFILLINILPMFVAC
jgi:hypothetical protein